MREVSTDSDHLSKSGFVQFTTRFALIHTLTYVAFGIFFMLLSDYFTVFAEDPVFSEVMKPADALSVRLATIVQLLRGTLLASAIYPFRMVIFEKNGWFKLFWLIYILTSLGAVITGPGSIEGFLYTKFSYNLLIGIPEITLQMLSFSWLFCRRKALKTARFLLVRSSLGHNGATGNLY